MASSSSRAPSPPAPSAWVLGQGPLLVLVEQEVPDREQGDEGDAEDHPGQQEPAAAGLQHRPAGHHQHVHPSRTSPTRSTKMSSRDRCTGTIPYSR